MRLEQKQQMLEDLARRLALAWNNGGSIELPDGDHRPANRDDAYFVQDRMADYIGEAVTGWKAGATSDGMRARDGHDDIVPGRTFRSRTFVGPNHVVAAAPFIGARMEPEFAFRINQDISPREAPWTADEISRMVTAHIAIEIISNRFPPGKSGTEIGTLLTIADNGGGSGLVVGDPIPNPLAVDFLRHEVKLTVDDGEPAQNSPPEIRCSPIDALTDVANCLSARGIALLKGQYVTTGSATATLPTPDYGKAVADFGSLGSIILQFEANSDQRKQLPRSA